MLDAAGLALFCVTGASTALDHGLAAAPAVILGAITGIGGGVLRDILVRQIPVVLREGLYAIPALIGAAIVVGAARAGAHGPAAAIIGAAVCFVIRLAGLRSASASPAPGAATVTDRARAVAEGLPEPLHLSALAATAAAGGFLAGFLVRPRRYASSRCGRLAGSHAVPGRAVLLVLPCRNGDLAAFNPARRLCRVLRCVRRRVGGQMAQLLVP